MRLSIRNLPFSVNDLDLVGRFQEFGEVLDFKLIRDRETGKSRGFAFVEMATRDALLAIQMLHRSDWGGRRVVVEEADPPPPRR